MPATRTTKTTSRYRKARGPLAHDVEIRKDPMAPKRYKTLDEVSKLLNTEDPYTYGLMYKGNYTHLEEPEFFQAPPPELQPEDPRPPPLRLSDFECTKSLGYGISSKVIVARTLRNTHPLDRPGSLFAMKIIEKKWMRNYDRDEVLAAETKQVERSILTELPWNPFVCGLMGTFVDSQNVYLALEYCPHASLRSIISSSHPLEPNVVQFYVCGITAGLAFLHDHDIIHRDIKPENILLGPGGYPVISDFGTARRLRDDFFRVRESKTAPGLELAKPYIKFDWNEMGTVNYQPPETFDITRYPYFGPGVDWWAVGVVIYEMTTGRLPFNSKDEAKLARLICKGKYRWPKGLKVGKTLKAIVADLLTIDPIARLGTSGCQPILLHPWFRNIDWAKIYGRHYVAPLTQGRSRIQEMYHRNPLPEQRHVPGLRLAEPPIELRYDKRYRVKEL